MRKTIVVAALLVVVPATAYAGFRPSSPCAGFAEGTVISMLDSCFAGTAQFAPAETTLTINNNGALPHTITAVDGSFDSGILQPGQTWQLTVAEPGVVRVFCILHGTADGEGMAGVIVVGDPAAGATAGPGGGTNTVPLVLGGGMAVAALLALRFRRNSRTAPAG